MVQTRRLSSMIVQLTLAASWACGAPAADVVIAGGRVIDPETGLDAIRHVAIRDGAIVAVSETPLTGTRMIDATGLVVAPGFVDLHEHGQTEAAYALMVRDGVTSAFELEVGTADVDAWYAERAGGQYVNHGVSIGHIQVRMAVMGDEGGLLPSGPGGHGVASSAQVDEMASRIEQGLEQGAVAVGFGTAYTPAATMDEIERMFRIAAEHGATAHVHMRGGLPGLRETIEAAARAGVSLHIVHANSSGGQDIVPFLAMIEEATARGQDVTTEAYPYGAGMTAIESALFDDWESWPDERFQTFQWVATGERLTRESFGRYRVETGYVIQHSRSEDLTRTAIANPITMIASDGFLAGDRGHPRTAGTYAKVLGRYVREEAVVPLPDAIRRMSYEPARRLERRVPAMRRKGRVQVGADADLTVFNPATVTDRATYLDGTIPSAGIEYVLVNGVPVVDGGEFRPDIRPGTAVRAPMGTS